MKPRLIEELALQIICAFMLLWMFIAAKEFPFNARLMPQLAASLGLIMLAIEFFLTLRRDRHTTAEAALEKEPIYGEKMRRTAPFLMWIALLYLGISLIGFLFSVAVFTLLFSRLVGKISWLASFIGTLLLLAGLYVMANAFNLDWPVGYFFDPFR